MKARRVSRSHRPHNVIGHNLSRLQFSNRALTSSCAIHSSWGCKAADTFIQGFYLYMKGEEITPMELSWVQCVFYVRVALIF